MQFRTLSSAVTALIALSLVGSAWSQTTTTQTPAVEPKKEEPKRDPKALDYEKAVKDLKKIDGPFTLYQRRKDILLELPEDKLGKIFYIQAAWNSGVDPFDLQAGAPVGSTAVDAFRWEKQEESISIVRPNLKFRWDKDDPFAVSAQRTFPEAYLGSFRIEQTNPEKKVMLVNVSSLFNGDYLRLNQMIPALLGGPYMLDRERSGLEKAKGFADNTTVQMKLHFMSQGGGGGMSELAQLLGGSGGNHLEDSRSALFRLTFNVWYPKDNGYKPRLADPRVGYFTQDFSNLDRFYNRDRTERYINRWNLVKKDPKAAVSEPVKPITWTLDNSIPAKWKPAVKEGILRWNKAYEALGFKNAVVVQDAPNDPDYDHADGRYNVIRLTMSEDSTYAIALARTDPFTGEILNASVTLDATMLSFVADEHTDLVVPGEQAERKALSALFRGAVAPGKSIDFLYGTETDEIAHKAEGILAKFGFTSHANCTYAEDQGKDLRYALAALDAIPLGKISKDQYVNQFLADVVSHEIGHTMGLRHNFIASTNLTTAQLADDNITKKQGITASVMDYTPYNTPAILKGGKVYYMPGLGAYDVWAIKYGYMPIVASTPVGERSALSRVASQSGLPGNAFMTDEDADAWNPYVLRFDQAKDPLAYSEANLILANKVLDYAVRNLPRAGESYASRTDMILLAIGKSFREARFMGRFLGGVVASRQFKGDANQKPTLAAVDATTQRQAAKLMAKYYLGELAFKLPASILNSMSVDRAKEENAAWNAPLRSQISTRQRLALAQMLSADTTDRIAENAFKDASKKDTYQLDEHYGIIVNSIFAEVGASRSVSALRRDLQRFAITALTSQAGAPQGAVNEDVRLVAADSVRKLNERFKEQLRNGAGLDSLTRIHVRDVQDQLARYIARQVTSGR